jgi:hypothetical protein
MSEWKGGGEHPDLDVLADFEAGRLGAGAAADVARHTERCVGCRLELKRLRRFAAIEHDEDPGAGVLWSEAEAELERAFRERILPEALPSGRVSRRAAWTRLRWPKLWLVPAAAAAVLLAVVFNLARQGGSDLTTRGAGPMRGGETAERVIVPLEPVGLLEMAPVRFSWSASRPFDSFTLEVVTAELEPVFARPGITDTSCAVADTLRALFVAGRTYLWSVQGHRGLTASDSSVHVWFKMPPAPPVD